ncbi:transglutaminase-like domain-containing protein [Pseudotamlana carrageenivorans]|nr:transglutaminase-like domain-containing protein [Tamlana carrageenivorans]
MKKVILQTLGETKKLAEKLKGSTVNETVKNIKDFVYWHVQYKQDITDQQLYSPSHTWAKRATGVDCKSYSIMVSSILTNLGIENSLRQIKQISYKPDYWTHVYVVLPAHNLVIDGTVVYNHEPLYIEYHDKPILSKGLNGLAQLSFNSNWCGCGSNIKKHNLPSKNLAELLSDSNTDISVNHLKHIRNEPIHVVSQVEVAELPHPKQCNFYKHVFGVVVSTAVVMMLTKNREPKKLQNEKE